jgi:hypothetical protein
VLASQGIPATAEVSQRALQLLDQGMKLFAAHARPAGVCQEVEAAEFAEIYRGEGRNAPETPLAEIYPRARRLALFAVTLGEALGEKIADLMGQGQMALGFMLDAIASEGAEIASERAGRCFLEAGEEEPEAVRVLGYSPGYCGWHLSGQRRLFARLHPEEIGITLNESFLMQPLKSVSGVLVAGEAEVHEFVNRYDFCSDCSTHACRERIASLRAASAKEI